MERMVIAGFNAKHSSRKGVYRNRNPLNLSQPPLWRTRHFFSISLLFLPRIVILSPPEILIVLQDRSVPYHSPRRTGRILKIQCLDLGSLLHHALSPSIPPVWSGATSHLLALYALPGRSFICLFDLSFRSVVNLKVCLGGGS